MDNFNEFYHRFFPDNSITTIYHSECAIDPQVVNKNLKNIFLSKQSLLRPIIGLNIRLLGSKHFKC